MTVFIQLSKYEQAALGQLSRVMSPAGDDGQIPVSPRPGLAGRGSCLRLSRLQWQGQGPRGRWPGTSQRSLDTGSQATAYVTYDDLTGGASKAPVLVSPHGSRHQLELGFPAAWTFDLSR